MILVIVAIRLSGTCVASADASGPDLSLYVWSSADFQLAVIYWRASGYLTVCLVLADHPLADQVLEAMDSI